MKISSKSILSPGRPRDPPASLSISLSRKLRNSRSIKGGASPAMFPATGKRRASGFDNPEPSSPKVTCIGQVRVKTKKKPANNFRTLSRRHTTGEVSFKKLQHSGDGFSSQECLPEQRNNQRWVHLPLTICEALREFSCLFPCRSSCSSTTTGAEKEEKTAAGSVDRNRQGSCGAVFARWLVALHDGDEGGRVTDAGAGDGETELVAGDDDEEDEDEEMSVRNARRHVFQDLEIVNDCIIQGGKDEGRVSICVPPKNALLLMRCRSDPMKMEALTNRSWEPSVGKNEEEDEDFVHEIEEKRVPQDLQLQKVMDLDEIHEVNNQQHHDLQEASIDQENAETNLEAEMKQSIQEEDQEQSIETNEEEEDQEQSIEINEEKGDQEQSIDINEEEEESMYLWGLFEENAEEDQEFQENDEVESDMEDAREELFEEDEDVEIIKAEEPSNVEKIEDFEEKNEEQMATEFTDISERPEETREEVVLELKEVENGVLERESEVKEERESSGGRVSPECLLLMMCEPKLSMEVSKETWICSTDFIRRHSGRKKPPPPPVKSVNDQSESKVNTTTLSMAAAQYEPELQQPARSSCSLPAPPSMAAMVEQKLAGYEPLVLTRCKSEPMRTASAKLVPESCFWKNRKLEPLGIGVAGLGF